ncbi:hypothetical protein BACCAP_00077 [Pseudoflavonifractor capillosus ATCC 29799]|uniref:Uncharacterized protein n=1 Tax=Pseudoflavonifractor capillosus ATCC 29799 TaxID=411467 RepID=A6NPG2_9FIRM|nr:hypothetical protein BACCAP_00077 [Pseudoflavonifractor capillosus ATCC 29799]
MYFVFLFSRITFCTLPFYSVACHRPLFDLSRTWRYSVPWNKALDTPRPLLLYLPHREEGAYGL